MGRSFRSAPAKVRLRDNSSARCERFLSYSVPNSTDCLCNTAAILSSNDFLRLHLSSWRPRQEIRCSDNACCGCSAAQQTSDKCCSLYLYFHGLLLTILKLILFYIIAEVLSKSKQMPLLYLFFRKPFTKASFVIRCITERDVSYGCSLETGDF